MNNNSVRSFQVNKLAVQIHPNRDLMGTAAAIDAAEAMINLQARQEIVRIIFAAAPSQNEFLATLGEAPGIDWSRVTAFHMDDYLGLPENAPQRFSSYLKEHLFDRVHPGRVHYLIGSGSKLTERQAPELLAGEIEATCREYSDMLSEQPIDIVCMGIGENGHIAFNDPPVANFNDPRRVKLVQLEERCRRQQVNDGCFATLEEVPAYALTLTIPALFAADRLYCMVPGPTKRDAVTKTLQDPISTQCPATILRNHPAAVLYLDADSAAGLQS